MYMLKNLKDALFFMLSFLRIWTGPTGESMRTSAKTTYEIAEKMKNKWE